MGADAYRYTGDNESFYLTQVITFSPAEGRPLAFGFGEAASALAVFTDGRVLRYALSTERHTAEVSLPVGDDPPGRSWRQDAGRFVVSGPAGSHVFDARSQAVAALQNNLSFSPSGDFLISSNSGGSQAVFDAETGRYFWDYDPVSTPSPALVELLSGAPHDEARAREAFCARPERGVITSADAVSLPALRNLVGANVCTRRNWLNWYADSLS